MGAPPINDAPFDVTWNDARLSFSVYIVQATASRTAAVLWVLSERDSPLNTVFLQLSCQLFRQRISVTERDIWFVRC